MARPFVRAGLVAVVAITAALGPSPASATEGEPPIVDPEYVECYRAIVSDPQNGQTLTNVSVCIPDWP